MNRRSFRQALGIGGVFVAAIAFLAYGAEGPHVEHHEGHDHGAAHAEHHTASASGLSIPRSLTVEHRELHEQLLKGTKEAGEVGKAASVVAELLHPHFVKEEEYALPLLGLLIPAAKGNVPEPHEAIAMAEKLKADLPHMLAEHRQIVAALDALQKAAKKTDKAEYVHFADKLRLHAETEEQVLYPAAILVGEYVKLKTTK